MHNLVPSRALARRSRTLLTIAIVVGALGAFIAAIGVVLYAIPLVQAGDTLYDLVRGSLIVFGALLFLLALVLVVRAVTWRTDNDLAVQVSSALGASLDARFTFIRNISTRELGYIDAILVGPPGVLTFRILDHKGILANEGADWLIQNKKGEWRPLGNSPTREVVADIEKLRTYLSGRNLGDVPVYGVIVFTTDPSTTQLMGKAPVVPPTHLASLIPNLGDNYLAKDRIDARRVTDTVRTLFTQ
jgi:hypothetical protein